MAAPQLGSGFNPWAIGAGVLGAGLSSFGGGQGWQRRYGKQQARNVRNAANEVAGNWFQPYTAQRFAPTQGLYSQLFSGAAGMDPYSMIQGGAGILSDNLSPANFQAQNVTPMMVEAERATAVDPTQINAMTTSFMNPYIDQVLDRATANARRQLGIQRAADAGRAAGLNAFGSSGQALENAATNEGFMRTLQDMEAQLRDRGFTQAQAAAMARAGAMDQIGVGNANRMLAAGQGNQSAAMQAALANQAAAAQAEQLRQSGRAQNVDIGRLLMGGGAGLIPQMAGLAQTQQGLAQQPLEFDFQEFMRRQNFDTNKLAALSGGRPNALMSFASGAQTNPWLSALGIGLGTFETFQDYLQE